MLRNILAVIVGYIVMAIVVGGGLAIAYLILGTEGAYKPASYEVTTTWLIAMLAVGIIAALLAGITCAKLSMHSKGAVLSLVGVVIVMTFVDLAMKSAKPEPTPDQQIRTGEVALSEAPMLAVSPLWFTIVNPIIGVVGVMAGASLICHCGGNSKTKGEVGSESD